MTLLTIKNISEELHIGKNKAYNLLKVEGFPYIKIGNQYLIPQEEFDKWIMANIGRHIDVLK